MGFVSWVVGSIYRVARYVALERASVASVIYSLSRWLQSSIFSAFFTTRHGSTLSMNPHKN